MSDKLTEIAEDSARGGFFLFTGNFLSLIILAVGSIIVARLIGPENYGIFSLSLVLPAIFAGVIDLGLNQSLTRFLAKYRGESRGDRAAAVLKAGLVVKLATGTLASLVCFVLSDMFATYVLNRPDAGFFVRVASISIFGLTVFGALNSSFTGLERMEGNALVMNIQSVVKTIVSPMLVIMGFNIVGALTGHIVSYFAACLVGFFVIFKYYRKMRKSSKNGFPSEMKIMLSYGFPLYVSSLAGLILSQYQTIILAFFATNFEIGNFTISVQLSALVGILIVPFGALFPVFSKMSPGSDQLKKLFNLSVKYVTMIVIPVTVAVAVLSQSIVYVLYGPSYVLAPSFLSLYVLVYFYTILGNPVLSHLFSGIGETKAFLKWNLISLLIFLPLAPILTNYYRVSGLILAYLISTLLSVSYGLSLAVRKMHVKVNFNASVRICLVSIFSAAPVVLLLHFSNHNFINLIVGGSIYLIVYLTLIALVGVVKSEDLRNFESIFNKIKILHPIVNLGIAYENRILQLRRFWTKT